MCQGNIVGGCVELMQQTIVQNWLDPNFSASLPESPYPVLWIFEAQDVVDGFVVEPFSHFANQIQPNG